MARLFGFEITRTEQEPLSFASPERDDGAITVSEGGIYGTYVDMDGTIKSEAELVTKYRDMAGHSEVDIAVDHIINDMIVQEPEEKAVQLLMDNTKFSEPLKKRINEEFNEVLQIMEFNELSYDIAKKWYTDGRLYYHCIIDENDPMKGITELRYIDPRKIRKVRQQKEVRSEDGTTFKKVTREYYVFNERGWSKMAGTQAVPSTSSANGLRIAKDSIIHCTSGIPSSSGGDLVLGHLHQAIKPLNMLKTMEDSLVIYRISRAPERRIFYIDVGNLPKMKAEQYVRDMMVKFKNKTVYDQGTGEIKDTRKFMTMLEDFWLPRREGGRGTEITTLPGGENLGQIDDILYFQKLLYKSLKVPQSRLDSDVNFNLGRSTEISRDEVNFAKFIQRLRNKFSILFIRALERQLILKQVLTPEEWDEAKNLIEFRYAQDNYYAELKEQEIMRERVTLLRDIDDYADKYYSHQWIRKNILKQSDEEMETMDEEIEEERNDPQYNPPMEEMPPGGPDGGAPENGPVSPQQQSSGPSN